MVFGGIFIFVVLVMLWRRCMRKQRVEDTAKFVSAKEWRKTLNDGEYYPERLYTGPGMAGRPDDLDHEGYHRDSRYSVYSHSVYSHSAYSQEMNTAWQEPGTYSIRDSLSVYERD